MLDYRPDLDPRTLGLLTDLREMIPTTKGYRAALAAVAHTAHTYSVVANETYPTAVFATRWLSTPGGIVIVGTNKRLNVYDWTNGFINVSKAGSYALASTVYQFGEDAAQAFDLCAFGDVIIACHKSTPTQQRSALDLTIATLFADLTDGITPPPQATACCVARNFVFLGDCTTWAGVTGSPDIIAWSGLGNHLDWSNNPTITQSGYARLNDTPGPITAVTPFRDGVVVFKASSMYLGRYVGGGGENPLIWDFIRISDKIGCVGHRSLVNIDSALVFVGRDDIYSFDGTYPVSITDGIVETLRAVGTSAFTSGTNSVLLGHDKPKHQVWVCAVGSAFVWDYQANRWGRLSQSPAIPCRTNADDFRSVTMSSVVAGIQQYTTSSNHQNLYTLFFINQFPFNRNSTVSTTGRVITGAIGRPDKLQTLARVNPLYNARPATVGNATLTVSASKTPGNFASLGAAVTLGASYRFDLLGLAGANNNFFRLQHDCAEDHELIGFDTDPNLIPAGSR